MEISSCKSYHAVTDGVELLRMADGKSVFKVYYLSIINRDRPELYEWEHFHMSKGQFEEMFAAGGHAGVGFVTAFPHITKIFCFRGSMETVLDVGAFDTVGMQPRSCEQGDNYYEFACYAEAVIAAEEYHAWAKAGSVDEYLQYWCQCSDFPVASNCKLGEYWRG